MDTNKGMTLIEVLLVGALLGILAAVAVPGFNQWGASQRLSSSARDVHMVLQTARSEAIKNGENVVVVFTEGVGTAGSYLAFIDDNGDRVQNGAEATVESGSLPKAIEMFDVGFDLAGSGTPDKDRTHFDRHGLTTGRNGEARFKNDYGKTMRVVLGSAGSSRVEAM